MKKIILSAVITPSDDAVTENDVLKSLAMLGSATRLCSYQLETVPRDEVEDLPGLVTLYVPPDDSEPYYLVDGIGEVGGVELTGEDAEAIQRDGVCIAGKAVYPRATRHGSPVYTTDENYAMGTIATVGGCRVADEEVFTFSSEDRGDDGGEEFWLSFAVPKGFAFPSGVAVKA